jgi:hypothetical protein
MMMAWTRIKSLTLFRSRSLDNYDQLDPWFTCIVGHDSRTYLIMRHEYTQNETR